MLSLSPFFSFAYFTFFILVQFHFPLSLIPLFLSQFFIPFFSLHTLVLPSSSLHSRPLTFFPSLLLNNFHLYVCFYLFPPYFPLHSSFFQHVVVSLLLPILLPLVSLALTPVSHITLFQYLPSFQLFSLFSCFSLPSNSPSSNIFFGSYFYSHFLSSNSPTSRSSLPFPFLTKSSLSTLLSILYILPISSPCLHTLPSCSPFFQYLHFLFFLYIFPSILR